MLPKLKNDIPHSGHFSHSHLQNTVNAPQDLQNPAADKQPSVTQAADKKLPSAPAPPALPNALQPATPDGTQPDTPQSARSPTGDAGSGLAPKEKFFFRLLVQLRNVFSPNVTLEPNMFHESRHQKPHRGKG